MLQKHLELTVQEAMSEISRHGTASVTGLVTVHSSVFRSIPLMNTYVYLIHKPGLVVADMFGMVKIPVISEVRRSMDFQVAKLLDGQVHVERSARENSVTYSLKGIVDNPFNRGWFGLGRQTYHYSYEVKMTL